MEEHKLKESTKFFEFSLVGATTFSIQLFLTVLLTETIHIQYYISYGIALIIAWSLNFMLNMELTFHMTDEMGTRIERFVAVAIGNALISWALVLFAVEFFHLTYYISIIAVAVTLAAMNFIADELWVFRTDKKK